MFLSVSKQAGITSLQLSISKMHTSSGATDTVKLISPYACTYLYFLNVDAVIYFHRHVLYRLVFNTSKLFEVPC